MRIGPLASLALSVCAPAACTYVPVVFEDPCEPPTVPCDGQGCNALGVCITCTSDTQCPEQTPYCDGEACVACRSHVDCPTGACDGSGQCISCDPGGDPFGGGTGTPTDPYLLCTPAQLDAVRTSPDTWFVLTQDVDLAPYLAGGNWTPLPKFAGTFDGAGHAIGGLYINDIAAEGLGLVTSVTGTVKNLVLTNVFIHGNLNIGGVAFWSEGLIENVDVTGTISSARGFVGGIVRTVLAGGTLDRASFEGTITAGGDPALNEGYVAGVVAFVEEGAVVQRVRSRGHIIMDGGHKAGGIASIVSGTLEGAVGEMDITSSTVGVTRFGGIATSIVGANAIIRDCYAIGNLENVEETAGLVVNQNDGDASPTVTPGGGTIERCYFAGTVSSPSRDPLILLPNNVNPAHLVWDVEVTGMSTSVTPGTGLTTDAMQSPDDPAWVDFCVPPWSCEGGAAPTLP